MIEKQMREFITSIQIVTGLMAGFFFAAGLKFFGDASQLQPLLQHLEPSACLGISIVLFAISYALWVETRDDY